jgi:L-ribulokinase
MRVVAGVDFGTLSVRVSIFEAEQGRLGEGTAEYSLHRQASDPDFATQSHADHMAALVKAMHAALEASKVDGAAIESIAIDTTGSSVVMLDKNLQPLGDYYLWCDHRSWREAAEITKAAHEYGLEAIEWCGGTYSSEWGLSKVLHWLRHNPGAREEFATALEHCDMAAATLCGYTDISQVTRSVCAAGHKWMWNPKWGGLPPQDFLTRVDPLFEGLREKLAGECATSDKIEGKLSAEWAKKLGLREGIPIPVGAFDAHWDAIGANIRLGDVVNVIGTSTCIIGLSDAETLVPGVCGVVPGSVLPKRVGIEAGLSAVGDLFEAIARRAGTTVANLAVGLESYNGGQTGLLRVPWDNGDRTVLVNPSLGGIALGWNLVHTAQDELFAAIEGTAMHTRIILERMQEYGTPCHRIINGGGIPQRNRVLNQVYANVLNKPVLVPQGSVTSLGSAIFAFVAAGIFSSIEAAQDKLCPSFETYQPEPGGTAVYDELFPLFRDVYFGFGSPDAEPVAVGKMLPSLRGIAEQSRKRSRDAKWAAVTSKVK